MYFSNICLFDVSHLFVYFLLMRHLIEVTNELFQKWLVSWNEIKTSESSYYKNY